MCLNIGVTPPDVSKPKSCATLEAWVDPFAQSPKKSLEIIGQFLFFTLFALFIFLCLSLSVVAQVTLS